MSGSGDGSSNGPPGDGVAEEGAPVPLTPSRTSPLGPSLVGGLTDYDRRLVALAEKSVAQAMAKQPAWLTDAQREAIRYEMMADLLLDPRGLAMLEGLVDGPALEASDEVDRSGRPLPISRADDDEGSGELG